MTIVAFALGTLLSATVAQAKPPSKNDVTEAHRRFQRATELYEESNLAGALAEFRKAYALAPNYKVLYNIGQLCFLLQDYPCAYTSFSRYLNEGSSDLSPDRREEVQRDVTRLQARVARLRIIASKPGAEVIVDDVSVGKTPLPEPVLVAAGRPRVRVMLPGHAPVSRVVEVAGMETAEVEVDLMADAAAPGPRVDLSRSVSREPHAAAGPVPKVPWVVTGVLAAAAGATGGLALWSSNDLKKQRQQYTGGDPAVLDDRSTRTKRLALATDILIGTTVVAAGIATYFTLSAPSHPEVALALSPSGVALTGGF
jgi:tetratricopeptide (TPR) repeat protein